MSEFDIDGTTYRTNRKLSAFEQLHVARRVAPLITRLVPSAQSSGDTGPTFLSMMGPIIDGLSQMPDEDVNYIINHCASVVQRAQGGGIWAPIWNVPAGRLMFEDLDGMQLLRIAIIVMQENLANFMTAPASLFQSPTQTTSVSPVN